MGLTDKIASRRGAFVVIFATLMVLVMFLQDTFFSFAVESPAGEQEDADDGIVATHRGTPNPNLNFSPNEADLNGHEEKGQGKTRMNTPGRGRGGLKAMAGAVKVPGVSVRFAGEERAHGGEVLEKQEANQLVVKTAGVVARLGNTSLCDCVKRSSLISKECGNTKFDRKFPLLVTGIGRSGTDFIHSELWAMGLRVSHDSNVGYGRIDGSVAWPEAFNNKPFMTHSARTKKAKRKTCKHEWWNFGKRWYGYYHVFHLVRHPLKTIQSRFNLGNIESFEMSSLCNTGTRTNKALKLMDRRLDITMQHWTLWNSFVEQYAVFRFRLEQLNSAEKHGVIQRILHLSKLDKLDVKGVNMTQVEASIDTVKVSAKKNSKHTKKAAEPLTWKKLAEINLEFTAMTQIQAMRYGYDIPKEDLLPFVWDECDPKILKVQRCYIEYYEGRWSCKLFSDACSSD